MASTVLALALFCAPASAGISHNLRHSRLNATGVADGMHFGYRLRVCNAYPNAKAMDIYLDGATKITGDEQLAYKTCREFRSPLKAGDRLSFKVGEANAGSFAVADLPNNDAVLLLVIHRHDTLSTAVSFESHVFAGLLNAQVAVIDTYKGQQRAKVRILDGPSGEKGARKEDLRFNSVVALSPGRYEVELGEGNAMAKGELVAVDRESYVVMRAGVEAQEGPSFPQALMIFPKSDPALLKSAAARSVVASSLILAVAAVAAAVGAV
mmetsp:Transcript_82565/g.230208  ORF Transcript_82565/g.230208 Transcript_82565/m.230208 type:complete len:267 (-) Transcript_82565:141-941(-)